MPQEVWSYKAVGHQLISKWLSYRVGQPLAPSDREYVVNTCRRIAAIIRLSRFCDAIYCSAVLDSLEA